MFMNVFILVKVTQCTNTEEAIINQAAQCVMDTIPDDIRLGKDLFLNNYLTHISSQLDPLNHHDYLMWPVFDGPEAWTASCHFRDTIKQCLLPLKRHRLPSYNGMVEEIIIPALYHQTLCEQQSTLVDPTTNNAECVHQRMLSDDVLRCQGLLSWFRGNPLFLINPDNLKFGRWAINAASAVYECIYERGNWRHSCGSEVEAMMKNLTKSFSGLAKLNPIESLNNMDHFDMCNLCKPGSDLTIYDKLHKLRQNLLRFVLLKNQSPYLFKRCKVVYSPLNQCHLRLVWRRGVYAMFCHKVKNVIIPEVSPFLPFCNFDEWISSAARICNMGYQMFMDMSSHIARCTNDQDELFPCYKGVYMDHLSWGLISAGRNWEFGTTGIYAGPYRQAYDKIKRCSLRLYDHLRQTCRHGPPVVQLIQDLRVVLQIDIPGIFSEEPIWKKDHWWMQQHRQHVNNC